MSLNSEEIYYFPRVGILQVLLINGLLGENPDLFSGTPENIAMLNYFSEMPSISIDLMLGMLNEFLQYNYTPTLEELQYAHWSAVYLLKEIAEGDFWEDFNDDLDDAVSQGGNIKGVFNKYALGTSPIPPGGAKDPREDPSNYLNVVKSLNKKYDEFKEALRTGTKEIIIRKFVELNLYTGSVILSLIGESVLDLWDQMKKYSEFSSQR